MRLANKRRCFAPVGTDNENGMTETRTSPLAKTALIIALISFFITILMILSNALLNSDSVAPERARLLALWTLFGGFAAIVYVLAPLTLLVMLIGIAHKLRTGKKYAAWGRLGIAFLIACASVVGSFWVVNLTFHDLH
jgi:uncharacterized membrane protein